MIVSITYEGLTPEDRARILRQLAEIDAKATFFADPPGVLEDIAGWRSVADAGHEIGNSALRGVTLSGELLNWTLRMVEQDLYMTQSFLEDQFGDATVPVFAYPGPFTRCADGDYRCVVEELFKFAVTPEFGPVPRGHEHPRLPVSEPAPDGDWWIIRADGDPLPVFESGISVRPVLAAARGLGRVPQG